MARRSETQKNTAAQSRRSAQPKRTRSTHAPAGDAPVRLQKVLAEAGLGSRRKCEELILAGRVEVDKRIVTKLGSRVDPRRQQVRVDGELVSTSKRVYFMVHKPPGVLSTNDDPAGRIRVVDFVPPESGRVYTVGRLDKASAGLILVTNDGELANLLTHPRHGVEKTYRVMVAGVPSREVLTALRNGVHLAEGFAKAEEIRIHSRNRHGAVLEMVLAEGRNREIRRMLARSGHKVLALKRIAIGRLRLGKLEPGESRPLKPSEVRLLQQSVGGVGRKRRKHGPGRSEGESTGASGNAKPRKKKGNQKRTGPPRRKTSVAQGSRGRRR